MAKRVTPEQTARFDELFPAAGHSQPFIQYLRQGEIDADTIYSYDPVTIPGLLQTESYAKMRLADTFANIPASQRAAKLALRLLRQSTADERGVRRHFIIPEHAIEHLRTSADPAGREQLAALVAAARKPLIDIHVISMDGILDAGTGMAPLTVAIGPDAGNPGERRYTAHTETPFGGITVSGEAAKQYGEAWAHLGGFALGPYESMEKLQGQ